MKVYPQEALDKFQNFLEWAREAGVPIVEAKERDADLISFSCDVCGIKSPKLRSHALMLYDLPEFGWIVAKCADGGCTAIYCSEHKDTEVPCTCY